MEVTRILGTGYIYDIEIVPSGACYVVYYRINDASQITDKDRRLAAWQNICGQKFKLFILENRA